MAMRACKRRGASAFKPLVLTAVVLLTLRAASASVVVRQASPLPSMTSKSSPNLFDLQQPRQVSETSPTPVSAPELDVPVVVPIPQLIPSPSTTPTTDLDQLPQPDEEEEDEQGQSRQQGQTNNSVESSSQPAEPSAQLDGPGVEPVQPSVTPLAETPEISAVPTEVPQAIDDPSAPTAEPSEGPELINDEPETSDEPDSRSDEPEQSLGPDSDPSSSEPSASPDFEATNPEPSPSMTSEAADPEASAESNISSVDLNPSSSPDFETDNAEPSSSPDFGPSNPESSPQPTDESSNTPDFVPGPPLINADTPTPSASGEKSVPPSSSASKSAPASVIPLPSVTSAPSASSTPTVPASKSAAPKPSSSGLPSLTSVPVPALPSMTAEPPATLPSLTSAASVPPAALPSLTSAASVPPPAGPSVSEAVGAGGVPRDPGLEPSAEGGPDSGNTDPEPSAEPVPAETLVPEASAVPTPENDSVPDASAVPSPGEGEEPIPSAMPSPDNMLDASTAPSPDDLLNFESSATPFVGDDTVSDNSVAPSPEDILPLDASAAPSFADSEPSTMPSPDGLTFPDVTLTPSPEVDAVSEPTTLASPDDFSGTVPSPEGTVTDLLPSPEDDEPETSLGPVSLDGASASPSAFPDNGRQTGSLPTVSEPAPSLVVFPSAAPLESATAEPSGSQPIVVVFPSAAPLESPTVEPSGSQPLVVVFPSAPPSAGPFETPPADMDDVAESLAPSASTSAVAGSFNGGDTIVVPSDGDGDGDATPELSLPQVPTGPEAVGGPAEDDTGVVEGPDGTSNSTLADGLDNPPAVIASGKYKELISTAPASRAFVPVMAVLGVLLVIALLLGLCCFGIVGKRGGSSYAGTTRPTDYGSGSGGGGAGATTNTYNSSDQPSTYQSGAPAPSTRGMSMGAGAGPIRSGEYDEVEDAYQPNDSGSYGNARASAAVRQSAAPAAYGDPDTQDYPLGGATTLKNASVGTAEYPNPSRIETDMQVGGARGALTGYEDDEYPYSHPYAASYRDSGQEEEGVAYYAHGGDDEGAVTFEGYGARHDDTTHDVYEGIPYADERTQDTFEDTHATRHTFQGLNAAREPGVLDDAMRATASDGHYDYGDDRHGTNEAPQKMPLDMLGDYQQHDAGDDVTLTMGGEGERNRLSTIAGGTTGRLSSFAARQSGSTMEVPRSAGSGHDSDTFYAPGVLSGGAQDAAKRYTHAPRKSRLAFVFGSGPRGSTAVPSHNPDSGIELPDNVGANEQNKQASVSSSGSTPAPTPYEVGIDIGVAHSNRGSDEVGDVAKSSFLRSHRYTRMDEEDEENAGDTANETEDDQESQFARGRAVFGSTRGAKPLGTHESNAGDHQAQHNRELNPEFEYLRKMREPYVKVVASRLSHRALSNSPVTEEEETDAHLHSENFNPQIYTGSAF